MNRQESDILNTLVMEGELNQRALVEKTGHSLGIVNRSLKQLEMEGYISDMKATKKAISEIKSKSPKRAIILAAGVGMRMVPINTEVPKGLLEVRGEALIERLIKHLHEAGIKEIYIIVGFMKEQYEYLIDEYDVKLIVNSDYYLKNNLHSLKLVKNKLANSYIIPCDIWCEDNPFSANELYSWYMVSDDCDNESECRLNRKQELTKIGEKAKGNRMIGIAYFTSEDGKLLADKISELCRDSANDSEFWETAMFELNFPIAARLMPSVKVHEINTYEQLRELDSQSNQLKTDAIAVICEALKVQPNEITDITVLKKGMTNRSFLFCTKGVKYIMRIPGEGTDVLINRHEEYDVYETIRRKDICDNIAYINPDNGYKITEYIEGARVCDCTDDADLKKCMKRLKAFHDMKLKVDHEFDIFGQIEFYESLWNGSPSVYRDYKKTKQQVFELKALTDKLAKDKVLTHIDAIPDNFLFTRDGDIRLIDWEYSGMQDPHVDIAMFCIYSLYEREAVDHLIDIYFEGKCSHSDRIKIYCYIAACGLLWSNWCEYKSHLGIEFGEYSLLQYRYAKDYVKIVMSEKGDL